MTSSITEWDATSLKVPPSPIILAHGFAGFLFILFDLQEGWL